MYAGQHAAVREALRRARRRDRRRARALRRRRPQRRVPGGAAHLLDPGRRARALRGSARRARARTSTTASAAGSARRGADAPRRAAPASSRARRARRSASSASRPGDEREPKHREHRAAGARVGAAAVEDVGAVERELHRPAARARARSAPRRTRARAARAGSEPREPSARAPRVEHAAEDPVGDGRRRAPPARNAQTATSEPVVVAVVHQAPGRARSRARRRSRRAARSAAPARHALRGRLGAVVPQRGEHGPRRLEDEQRPQPPVRAARPRWPRSRTGSLRDDLAVVAAVRDLAEPVVAAARSAACRRVQIVSLRPR